MDETLIKQGVEFILDGLGVDRTDRNFVDTPDRVFRVYKSLFEKAPIHLPIFDEPENNETIVLKGHKAWGLCPHHLLPVEYSISVGYIPQKGVLGLSKLARIVDATLTGPLLQESVAPRVTELLVGETIGALGAGCVVSGKHGCMQIRGVRTQGHILTSSMKGVFLAKPEVRAEFFSLIK